MSDVINALRSIASTTSCEKERSLKERVIILQHSVNLLLAERGERKASVFPFKKKESTICFQNKLNTDKPSILLQQKVMATYVSCVDSERQKITVHSTKTNLKSIMFTTEQFVSDVVHSSYSIRIKPTCTFLVGDFFLHYIKS